MISTKDAFVVRGLGGKRSLSGIIKVNGSKNAVLPLLAASLVCKGSFTISNVPLIEDVFRMNELLSDLGVAVTTEKKRVYSYDSKNVRTTELDHEISKRFRASVILTGPLLGRFGKVSFPHPGGCVIGERPIDIFLYGYKKLGAEVSETGDEFLLTAPRGGLIGASIFLPLPSVTATEAFVLAALQAKGITTIKNAAVEPEVTSLVEFLISAGASIKGAGTSTLEIHGKKGLLNPRNIYKTIPDRLEAGGFLVLAALAAKDVTITNCEPEHLEIIIETLRRAGVPIEVGKSTLRIRSEGQLSFIGSGFKTHEYPGFPTDMQAPMTVFLTQAKGENLIFETIFEGRLAYTQDLVRMGADITMWDPHRVMVKGPRKLKGKVLDGPDIRAGLAFVIAAAVAKGQSVINNIYYIDRGYERVEERLKAIGLDISRVIVS